MSCQPWLWKLGQPVNSVNPNRTLKAFCCQTNIEWFVGLFCFFSSHLVLLNRRTSKIYCIVLHNMRNVSGCGSMFRLCQCLPCFSASTVTGFRSLSSRCLNRLCSTSSCCSPATSIASILRSEHKQEKKRMHHQQQPLQRFSVRWQRCGRHTGTRHVREDDVDVNFQFVSSRRVDVELRMNLQGKRKKSGFSFVC